MTKPAAIENSDQLLTEMQTLKGALDNKKVLATKDGRVYAKKRHCKFVRFILCLFTFGQYFKPMRADRVVKALGNRCTENTAFMNDAIKDVVKDILQTLHGKSKNANTKTLIIRTQLTIDPNFVPPPSAPPLDSPESAIAFLIVGNAAEAQEDTSSDSPNPVNAYLKKMLPKMLTLARALPVSDPERKGSIHALTFMLKEINGTDCEEPTSLQQASIERFFKSNFAQRFPAFCVQAAEGDREKTMKILTRLALQEFLAQAQALPESDPTRENCIQSIRFLLTSAEHEGDEDTLPRGDRAVYGRFLESDFVQRHPLKDMFISMQ